MSYVFLSHSSNDSEFTRLLADQLTEAGIKVWVDMDNLRVGDAWVRSIQEGVENCGAFVIVLSRASRDSEWCERETLLAMDLKKPVYIALIERIPLPLHLINRQFLDFCEDAEQEAKKLIVALRRLDFAAPPKKSPRKLSTEPDRDNFFKYLEQLPGGQQNAVIARELYDWAKSHMDGVEFGGKITPGFHARVYLGEHGDNEVTVFSVWAYPRNPAVQVQFQYLAPFDDGQMRLAALRALNRLMPPEDQLADDRIDRRPTFPLNGTLNAPGHLEAFRQIMGEIVRQLRAGSKRT